MFTKVGPIKGDFGSSRMPLQSPDSSSFTFNAQSPSFQLDFPSRPFKASKFTTLEESPRGASSIWQQSHIFSQFLNPTSPISPMSTEESVENPTKNEGVENENPVMHKITKMFDKQASITTKPNITPLKISTGDAEDHLFEKHLKLLQTSFSRASNTEVQTAPVFTAPVLKHHRSEFKQFGFFAGLSDILDKNPLPSAQEDPRVFFNISTPSSAFICGSQGSGKSHTLSCLLENCLMKSDATELKTPLAALVLHYDSFNSDECGTPCEAAYLASNPNIKVRILCSQSNIETIKTDLNTKRMLDLMAVSPEDGPMPLYLHSINRILRELRIEQQTNHSHFNYAEFKSKIKGASMSPAQLAPLTQRLDTLESFMPSSQLQLPTASSRQEPGNSGNDWSIHQGSLIIVDLSCPCVTSEGACALFNICLSIFLEQKTNVGRVIALDEAHKYMNSTTEAANLSETLLSSIRLQRHLGTRILISTQEPTISPALLDLCSIIIVHRFTSPEWLRCLRQHVAVLDHEQEVDSDSENYPGSLHRSRKEIFEQIVRLGVGEALLFAPSAIIAVEQNTRESYDLLTEKTLLANQTTRKLGLGYLRLKIRDRLTEDGGKSIMAV